MKKVPSEVFERIKNHLWSQADTDGWLSLGDQHKTSFYERWSSDKNVGKVLEQYMEPREIRVYIKDTIMKPYPRERLKDPVAVMKAAGLAGDEVVIEKWEKPHGRLLFGNRVICWGQAKHWKSVLLSVYEKAYHNMGKGYAAVLMRPVGKIAQPSEKAMVEDLAKKLEIERVVWVD